MQTCSGPIDWKTALNRIYKAKNASPAYSLSHKIVNTREYVWNVYCFATNQMRDETAKDNRQTAAWISHDLTRNNELAFSFTTNLQFYRFQILILFLLYFQLIYKQRIDMNDIFVTNYGKAIFKPGFHTSGKSQTIGNFNFCRPSQILPIYRIFARGLCQIFPIMNYLFVIGGLEPSNLGDW